MAIKVYISGVCGSQEVRKRQQRVLFVLTSMKIDYETVDITEPGRDEEREYMKEQCKQHDKTNVLPPQIFNDSQYCGDYSDFEVANDDDKLHVFLKLQEEPIANEITMNGNKEEEERKDEEQAGDKGENEDVDIFSNKDDDATGDSGVGEENKEEEKTEEMEEEKPKDDDVELNKPEENKDEESEEEEEEED